MSQQDVNLVVDAGWTEGALEDAIAVCALFNLANRMSLAYGLNAKWSGDRGKILDHIIESGYV